MSDCKNPDCDCYPYYGMAPHSHVGVTKDPRSFIGSTVMTSKDKWPDNFVEELEQVEKPGDSGQGIYYCPTCRAGQPK